MISPLASPFRGGFRNLTPMRGRGRGSSTFSPQALGLTALYDVHNGGSTTQVTDSGGNGLNALAFAASTAAPTYLAYDGTPYVWLPGVAGNNITTPDAAQLDIVGDIDFRAFLAMTDWTPTGSNRTIIGKWEGAGNRSYTFGVHTTGVLRVNWSADGTNGSSIDSSTSPTVSDGAFLWVRSAFDVDNGASQRVLTPYTSADGATWSALGTATTVSGATSIFASAARLELGTLANDFHLPMKISRAQILNGIDGTSALDFAASNCTQSGYTSSASNVWTVNYGTSGLCAVVKSSAAGDTSGGVSTDGSNDYATGPAAAIPSLTSSAACTLYTVTRPRATMTTNMTFFSTRSGTGAGVTLRMASATTVVADISDGTSTVTTPAVTITPGTMYVLGVVVPTSGGAYCFANTTAGSTQARTGNDETGGALTVFANSTPTNYCRTHSRVPYAAVPRALTAVEISRLVAYYGAS